MLSASQERLLRYLGGFPASLEQAWDVPRTISLPGLAEAMGVVRSGLNQPLSQLIESGLVSVRIAHVIGGGSRRRQVYHTTEAGRQWLVEHPESQGSHPAAVSPQPASHVVLVGRDEDTAELKRLVDEHGCVVVGGLSGVGKTALVRWMTGQKSPRAGVVRWADIDEFSDVRSVMAQWFPDLGAVPTGLEAILELLKGADKTHCFVVDDLHRLDLRHAAAMTEFLLAVRNASMNTVLVSRLPLPLDLDWPILRLSSLDPEVAHRLLGDHLDEGKRRAIAKSLGGHPMALHLYAESETLPEEGVDIQRFVEQTILHGLSDEEREALDSMVLFPRPLPVAEAPHADMVGVLDDHALLRWSSSAHEFEVQHLVRNVRRAMLQPDQLEHLHRSAVKHWSSMDDRPDIAVLRLYHELALEQNSISSVIEASFDHLIASEAAALAVIVDRASQRRPEDEDLHYWAARIALQRLEPDRVRQHAQQVTDEARHHELRYHLALLEGDEEAAENVLRDQLERASETERLRWLVGASVQRLEDRLFDDVPPTLEEEVRHWLDAIQLPDNPEQRSTIMVSMSTVQHGLALLANDRERANAIVEGLESLSHAADPLVQLLAYKNEVHFSPGINPDDLIQRYRAVADAQSSLYHRGAVGLYTVEQLVRINSERASEMFESLPTPDASGFSGAFALRYRARWWYLQGHLGKKPAVALREAAQCFRLAGCHRAARAVAKRLHRVL